MIASAHPALITSEALRVTQPESSLIVLMEAPGSLQGTTNV
jgi:hypothetical protein